MKKILGSLLLLLLCLPLMAQKADGKQKVKVKKLYSLYGEAYDSFTRLALPAKICLMKKDSTMVDTTTVDVFNNRKELLVSISSKPLTLVIMILMSTIHLPQRVGSMNIPCLSF